MNRFLLDENLPKWWQDTIRRLEPSLEIRAIGDGYSLPRGSKDPRILAWCETNDFYLLTEDRSTMPGHLIDHVASGGEIPGIFSVNLDDDLEELAGNLVLIAECSFPDEYLNQFRFL